MVQVTKLEVMQSMLRDLMQEIHKICEENNLMYNLFGGSLLGAVRHQDIIPWDDDIDITMPRPDYERFKEIIKKEYSEKFDLYDYPRDNYIYPFAKLCKKNTTLYEDSLKPRYSKLGLYVDIFPVDGIPETDEVQIRKRFYKADKYKIRTIYCAAKPVASPVWWKKPFVLVKILRSAFFGIKGYKYYVKKQIEETLRYSYEECDRVGFVSFGNWGIKGIIDKQSYLDRRLYKFGQYEFWGIKRAEDYLTSLYGDYMTPPPENKRTPCHNYRLYVED